MKRVVATQTTIVAIGALLVFGIHKSDQATQARITANTKQNAVLTYNLCAARNKAIVASNARWERLAVFMQEAASVPANAQYEKRWQAYAASIQPLPTIQCGDAP